MFIIDKQTLADLNVTNSQCRDLFDLFDCTITLGGRDMLYSYFLEPLSAKFEILDRQWIIRFMQDVDITDILDKYMMQDLEQYLSLPLEPYSPTKTSYYLELVTANFLSADFKKRDLLIRRSIHEIAKIIDYLNVFLGAVNSQYPTRSVIVDYCNKIDRVLEDIDLGEFEKLLENKLSLELMIKYDYLFRNIKRNAIREVFTVLYQLDALYGVAQCTKGKHLVFPGIEDHDPGSDMIRIRGGYNLFLENPVKNDIEIKSSGNLWYLTGANMTGKSTLLKTIGTCVYLAHLGFPVPADAMETVLFDGISATINLGDDISAGASHFFNEVLRVKHLAELLAEGKKMFVLMDELFKGTNHNDASEATLELISCLRGFDNSIFLLSSHITEISSSLKGKGAVMKHLGVKLDKHKGLIFTYELSDGVAEDKLGMWLLQRECVFEILWKAKSRQ
ncbi:DNA mismatch repair protein MutS [Sphingobacterium sp. DR205]|uniref:MutS-related protein n=1 Tax=Sphingobacterium sp. DR205 TaxID=2713573 RepID=UPI0013E4A2CC|nr:DNA mismatch repair protein MutS [Sphingobacterium sp. DR205]QIH32973.1 DNA mismatch repair protein MutS [Sphingobacterium sp. DR205]